MRVNLTLTGVVVAEAEIQGPVGVPFKLAILADPGDPEVCTLLEAELDDDEAWELSWRGSREQCVKRLMARVTDNISLGGQFEVSIVSK